MLMISRIITLPELGLISGTRAALGAGLGLLLADRLNEDQRRAVGWTLLAVGAISTVPLLAEVMSRHPEAAPPVGGGRGMRPSPGTAFTELEAAAAGW
jgi:hypothetical protein